MSDESTLFIAVALLFIAVASTCNFAWSMKLSARSRSQDMVESQQDRKWHSLADQHREVQVERERIGNLRREAFEDVGRYVAQAMEDLKREGAKHTILTGARNVGARYVNDEFLPPDEFDEWRDQDVETGGGTQYTIWEKRE